MPAAKVAVQRHITGSSEHPGTFIAERQQMVSVSGDGSRRTIVVNDVMFVPDLMQVLGPLLAPPSGATS